MFQKILAALKTRFPGVSDAILGRIATRLAQTVTNEDGVQSAVDAVTFQSVLESYGDSRATEAQQTAVANYEKKHKLKDGKPFEALSTEQKPNEGQKPEGAKGEEIPSWAKALSDSIKAVSDRLDKVDSDRTAATRRQRLEGVTAKLPENLRKPYARISLDSLSEEDFESMLADVTKEVEGISSSLTQKGAVFGRPASGGNKGQQGELTEAQKAAIAHREGAPSGKDAQPF